MNYVLIDSAACLPVASVLEPLIMVNLGFAFSYNGSSNDLMNRLLYSSIHLLVALPVEASI